MSPDWKGLCAVYLLLRRVSYLGSTAAFQQKLAFINDAGNAVMKVDNSTVLTDPNSIRNSIRVASTDFYTVGSLWTADMVHVPFGVRISLICGFYIIQALAVFSMASLVVSSTPYTMPRNSANKALSSICPIDGMEMAPTLPVSPLKT